jgi:ATP-dependent Zn protease
MLFSIRIKSAVLLIFITTIILTTPDSNANKTPGSTQHFNPASNFLDMLNDQTQQQLDEIHGILSDLSAIISDNQISGLKRKKIVIANIQSMMRDIESKKNILTVTHDPTTVFFMLRFARALSNHILEALNRDFEVFVPFNSDHLITQVTRHKNVSEKEIFLAHQKSIKRLDILKQQADSAGLRWYNKAYRKIDYHIVEPASRYGSYVAAISFIIWYCWWHLNSESCPGTEFKIPGTKKFLIGQVPTPDPITGIATNQDKIGFLGKVEQFIANLGLKMLPIGGALIWMSKDLFTHTWTQEFEPWLHNRLTSLRYRLKGGAYITKANKIDKISEQVTFDDLVGLEQVKEQFRTIVDYLENPERYDRQKLTPAKGYLLVGPTRTGKSFSVRALYGEINRMFKKSGKSLRFTFHEFSAAEVNSLSIEVIMYYLKTHAPCIVFFDEIDLWGLQRTGSNEKLSGVLTSMSGMLNETDPGKQVIIIAATNKPESLDTALRQPGRFEKEIRLNYPTLEERKIFLTRKIQKLSLNMEQFGPVIDKIAYETEGVSYEALKGIIDHAVLKARLQRKTLTSNLLEYTLDNEIRHIMPTGLRNLAEHEKELLASHFAGHALALQLLDAHTKLAKVTINPVMTKIKEELIGKHLLQGTFAPKQDAEQERYEQGGIFTYQSYDTMKIMHKQEKLTMCKFHLAGIAAEKIIYGTCSYSCHTKDKEQALAIAQSLTFEGMDPDKLPKDLRKKRFDEAFALLDQCEKEVTQLLSKHKAALRNIARELQEFGTLSEKEVAEIIADTEQEAA